MTQHPPPRSSPIWSMGCMILIAWLAVGVYRRQVPPVVTATAIVQIPTATDLGSVCRQSELADVAIQHLEAQGDVLVVLEDGIGQLKLSGELTAKKIGTTRSSLAEAEVEKSKPSRTAWELTYRTPLGDRAIPELTALITALESRFMPANSATVSVNENASVSESKSVRRHELDNQLQELTDDQAVRDIDPSRLAGLQERIRTLQRALTEAQNDRLKAEEEWRLVNDEYPRYPHLDAIAARLSPGPIQNAVLQVELQLKRSSELTRLNESEQRLSSLYGEKHPKLVEVRARFDQLLADLGGWDQVLNAAQVPVALQTTLSQILKLKQQHAADLETQLELEQSELTTWHDSNKLRSRLEGELTQLDRELANDRAAGLGASASTQFQVERSPELATRPWHADLPTLMATATLAAMVCGWCLHRFNSSAHYHVVEYRTDAEPTQLSTLPPVFASPKINLSLAQRRALRQARLQQAYAD